jgi:DNA-binding PadR family transcriptional regulator
MSRRFGPGSRFFGAEWNEWFGGRGGHGPFGMGQGRRVDRGDVKFLILTVLQEGPKHGYEIIKEIEKRSAGAYAPSAGTVYPTLQMLEDMGYVRSRQQDERRIYEITEGGRAYLAGNQEAVDEAWGRFEGWDWRGLFGSEEQRQLQRELLALAGAIFGGGRFFRADAKTLKEMREALQKAREKIDALLAEES